MKNKLQNSTNAFFRGFQSFSSSSQFVRKDVVESKTDMDREIQREGGGGGGGGEGC